MIATFKDQFITLSDFNIVLITNIV